MANLNNFQSFKKTTIQPSQVYNPREMELVCPNCGSVGARIVAGEKFSLEAIDVE